MLDTLRRAPKRFAKSFSYCRDAFRVVWKKEESFRLEMLALAIMLFVLAVCGWPLWKKAAMLAGFILIPLMEIVNSAIEDVCDLISGDFQEGIKNAKDKGALAVLAAIVFNALLLIALVCIED